MAQIKNWLTGETILEYEGDLKTAVVEAVQAGKLLCYADLGSANLRSANLGSADLGSADLRSANLRSANLRYADLRYADLRSADLGSANLRYADLRSADLRSADLRYADLRSADLRYADLRSADLRYADLRSHPIVVGGLRSDGYQFLLTNFPETGLRIQAGCRDFKGVERAREHWTAKGGTLGAESLAILDHLLNLARIRGIVPAEEPVTAQ